MRVRWKLSKYWQKPFHDPFFETLIPAQWMFYASMIGQDQREEEELWRDRLEYIARFVNNEAVDKIQAARKKHQQDLEDGRQVDAFNAFLEQTFGRGLGDSTHPNNREDDDVDSIRVIKD